MSSDIKYSLYKDSSALEETRLRSILLFNGKVKKQKRQDLITKAILSIILAENGFATRESIIQQLNSQFNLNYNAGDVEAQIQKLHKIGLLESVNEPLSVKDSDKKGRSYFLELEQHTEALLDDILTIAQERYAHSAISTPDDVKKTIRKALSVYYSMNGYIFFDVQKKEGTPVRDAAVSIVKDDIEDKRIAESIIRALADVIEMPNELQKNILTQWARAFVAMESMSIDPLLNNFKSKNLKNKEFIIDTDVVLYCLTSKARYSEDYRNMIAKLKDLGCKMYIVPGVVREIQKHIDAAKKSYSFSGSSLMEYPDEFLYDKVGNVFIDDYVHIEKEATEKTPFNCYIENFYDPEYPALLQTKLANTFSKSTLANILSVDTQTSEFAQLEKEVYDLTIKTLKAQNRSEEDNQSISYLDTFFYMAASKNNDVLDDCSMLSGKTYILTDSTRAIRAANNLGWKKRNIICHPNALMAIFLEMGDVKSRETIINLFDNPFLTYVADSVWNEIDDLLKKGAVIKHKGFDRLRADVDKQFDNLLTKDISEAVRNETLKEFNVFLPDMIEAGKEREEKQQAKIKELEQENAGLKKSLIEARSVKARSGARPNTQSNRKKKRKR